MSWYGRHGLAARYRSMGDRPDSLLVGWVISALILERSTQTARRSGEKRRIITGWDPELMYVSDTSTHLSATDKFPGKNTLLAGQPKYLPRGRARKNQWDCGSLLMLQRGVGYGMGWADRVGTHTQPWKWVINTSTYTHNVNILGRTQYTACNFDVACTALVRSQTCSRKQDCSCTLYTCQIIRESEAAPFIRRGS